MPTKPIDLREPLTQICAALHIEYSDVLKLTIEPNAATALITLTNENDKRYVDTKTGGIACAQLRWNITS